MSALLGKVWWEWRVPKRVLKRVPKRVGCMMSVSGYGEGGMKVWGRGGEGMSCSRDSAEKRDGAR